MRQADHSHRNLGRRTVEKDQGDEQVGEREQAAQIDHTRQPRENADCVMTKVISVFVSLFVSHRWL